MKFLKKIILFLPILAMANPQGLNVKVGFAEVKHREPQILQVNCSDKAILEWEDFSIDPGEQTAFSLPTNEAAILNRVVGENISEIHGILQCNGKLYLINPKGIVFGKDSVVDTKELLASTLNVNNEEFLTSETLCFQNTEDGKIIHLGEIKGQGNIYLLSKQIESHGDITTKGKITLATADRMILEADENIFIEVSPQNVFVKKEEGIIQNGKIQASQIALLSDGSLYDLAIGQSGVIDAKGLKEKEGRVFLTAHDGRIEICGQINATADALGGEINVIAQQVGIFDGGYLDVSNDGGSGKILIRSDDTGYSYLGPDAVLSADALAEGDGGVVEFLSDNVAFFYGEISAKGGTRQGNGGYVDVSGRRDIFFHGDVNTSAINGRTGDLVIDPTDITISTGTTTPPSFAFPPPQTLFTRPGPIAILNTGELVSQLDNNNVTVSTFPGLGAPLGGRITVNNPIIWKNGFDLTLNADENIVVNEDIIGGIGGNLTFTAGGDVIFNSTNDGLDVHARSGNITITAGLSISLNAVENYVDVRSLGGNIDANATLNVLLNASSTAVNGRAILANQLFSGAFGNIDVGAANVTINGGGAQGAFAGIRSNNGGGNINVTATSAISLNGGTADDAAAVISSARDVIIDAGTTLTLTSGIGSAARIISETGIGTIDVGTVLPSNLTMLGDVTGGEAVIAVDSTLNVTGTQTINMTNAAIRSRQASATIDTPNQINLTNSELFARDTLTVQNATLLDLDSSSAAIGVLTTNITVPTVDLTNDSRIRGKTLTITGTTLTADASRIRSPTGSITLNIGSVTLDNATRVFTGSDFTLNGTNLLVDNDSTIVAEGNVNITQTGLLNDVQILGTTLSSAVTATNDVTIQTETFTLNNSKVESSGQIVNITTTANASLLNNASVIAKRGATLTVGGILSMNNSTITSASEGVSTIVTGAHTMQANSVIQGAHTIDMQANSLSIDNSDVTSFSRDSTFTVTNNFDLLNTSQYSALTEISGTAANLTINNSTMSSADRSVTVSGLTNVNLTNNGAITAATDVNLSPSVTLDLTGSFITAGIWTVNSPTINLTNSTVTTDQVLLNISQLNLTNSQVFIIDSIIEQP